MDRMLAHEENSTFCAIFTDLAQIFKHSSALGKFPGSVTVAGEKLHMKDDVTFKSSSYSQLI